MRFPRAIAAAVLVAAACGDNLPGDGPPIAPASSLFIVAHLDDDQIFMQPQLIRAVIAGSSTSVYVLSGDPAGVDNAHRVFTAAMIAYEHAAGASGWDCGYTDVTGLPAHHCRLRDAGVSMIGLDVAEGGRHGERPDSLLHLIEGTVTSLPLLGRRPGRVTIDSLTGELAALIAMTAPDELHVLDFAAVHGDDHPGHTIAASFALWAAARAGYRGPIVAHRGYNVDGEPVTLSDADYALARPMLGYFDACYFRGGPCGRQPAMLEPQHDRWLQRQYASTIDAGAGGELESVDLPGACLAIAGDALGLAGCADPGAVRLEREHLIAGTRCVASGPGNDDPLVLGPCDDDPARSWLLDGEGLVWNARPPAATAEMDFDHTRCLAPAPVGAPVCGSRLQPRWRLIR